MGNFFSNFKLFESKFPSTIKKQFEVPKSLWYGMPLMVSNAKLGKYDIKQPKMFYVTDYDKKTVTLKPMPKYPGIDTDDDSKHMDDDQDDEINRDKLDDDAGEVIIARKSFYKLLEPEGMQAGGGDIGGI
jgi:hypothetical protein